MWRMEADVRDEEYSEEKYANLWIFLSILLDNTLAKMKGDLGRHQTLIPFVLIKILMVRMEEGEEQNNFDFDKI